MAWLAPSPGRRRLRFSFQINDVKDQLGGCQAHRYARWRRGGASLEALPGSVNRLANYAESTGSERKVHRGAAGACPISPSVSRLREWKIGPRLPESRNFFSSRSLSEARARLPAREARRIAGACLSCKRYTRLAQRFFGRFLEWSSRRRSGRVDIGSQPIE